MFRIIIADDAIDVRRILSRELVVINDDCMPKIYTAKNGVEALDIFKSELFDVVITDVRMPLLDGIKLCESIRKISETTVIILITAFQDFDSVKDAIPYNISGLLCKPINEDFLEQLRMIVYKTFKKKQMLSENKLYSPEYNLKKEVIDAIESKEDTLAHDIIQMLTELYNETENIQLLIEQCVPILRNVYSYYAMKTEAMPYSGDDFKRDINEMYTLGNAQSIIKFMEKIIMEARSFSKLILGDCNDKLSGIKKYIDMHYNEKRLYVGFLAEKFDISRSYMCMLFKEQYGMNINSYINQLRIDAASELLKESNFSISKISEMVGYSERRIFANAFKKLRDMLPTEYRKKYKLVKENQNFQNDT